MADSIKNKRIKWFDDQYEPEEILSINDGPDFTEIVWTMGGDVMRDRIYGDSEENFEIRSK